MKMDFRARAAFALIVMVFTTACGQQRQATTVMEKPSVECEGDAIPNRFIVRFRDGQTKTVYAPSREQFINGYLTENLDAIEFAEHDFRVRHKSQARVAATWANNWGPTDVGADTLWAQGVRGSGVVVAVIDTGMDITHAQLRRRLDMNVGEQGLDSDGRDRATNGVDDDGNGYVDDSAGYDFVNYRPLTRDHSYHGTHVSGIIAAEHADTSSGGRGYVQGIAPGAKILPLAFLDESGAGGMGDAVNAIKYAVQRGAHIINASWGGEGCSRSLKEVVQTLEAQNVFFVAAAGNEKTNVDRVQMFPASLNLGAMITVGSIGTHHIMSRFSNYGSRNVHIFAPGEQVVSTIPGGEMAALDGTSMAAPIVSGAVALLMSAEPSASIYQIRQTLYNMSAQDPDYLNASRGRLSLANSVLELRRLMGK